MGTYNTALETILILFPFVIAAVLHFIKTRNARRVVAYGGCGIIIATVLAFAVRFFMSGEVLTKSLESTHVIDTVMLCIEFLLMILVVFLSFKHKKYYAALLSISQTALIAWLEICHPSDAKTHFLTDNLTVIMCLIIGIVGCLICIYAIGYMRRYHHHHTEYKDRRTFFFPMLFVFIGAMFGLVLSDNLIWIYFFWEITSISSFLLIGYTKTEEAINNSFRALWMNLLGGLGFAIAIVIAHLQFHIVNLSGLLSKFNEIISLNDYNILVLVVILLAFAGLTKSAQMPFSKWLLGAMVAPTPTSALLHSATMVKAGVYLLIRLAPAMHGNVAGTMVSYIGGITFLVTSMIAITESDAKKVLAYSTISNLGIITACAGCGTEATVWAGILLMMFHAVSKSMLFQAVGAIENARGSRDIEDMHGLIKMLPELAVIMIIGICAMFLAPFGMLVSKWAALKSFIDSGNIILVCFICFGSATTMVYWTKWLCKVLACTPHTKHYDDITTKGQWFSLKIHSAMTIALCASFPFIAVNVLEPLIRRMFHVESVSVLQFSDMVIIVIMLVIIFAVPLISKYLADHLKAESSLNYLGGINMGDNKTFEDSFHNNKKMYLSGWYMEGVFSGAKMWLPTVFVCAAFIIITIAIAIGGAL